MYKKVPEIKNKCDYTQIEMLYNKYKWNAKLIYVGSGNFKAIIVVPEVVGYDVKKGGIKALTNKFIVHYSRKKVDII